MCSCIMVWKIIDGQIKLNWDSLAKGSLLYDQSDFLDGEWAVHLCVVALKTEHDLQWLAVHWTLCKKYSLDC